MLVALLIACIQGVCLSSSCSASDQDGRRVLALIIGNGDYQGLAKLTNATRDAKLVSSTLQEIGVDSVITKYDLSRASMSHAVNEFLQSMKKFDVGVFYFAGHGMQDEFQDNYLIPIDYQTNEISDLFSSGFPISRLVRGCARLEDKAFVMFLDACRNNPFKSDFRDSGGGLGEPAIPSEGVLVGFSTESGKVAGDFSAEDNGLYAIALSSALRTPNLKAEDVLKEVGSTVRETSKKVQSPEWWGNLSGEVILHYDSEQYEIKISEIQARAVEKVNQFIQDNELFYDFHVRGLITLDQIATLSYNFMAYRRSHLNQGERRLMTQADLYSFIIEYYKFLDGRVYNVLDESVENLFSTDMVQIHKENSSLMNALGLATPGELKMFLWYVRVVTNPDEALHPEFLESFVEDLWNVDLATWYIGNSWLGSVLQNYSSANSNQFPRSHHFTVAGDTIENFCRAAYPRNRIMPFGRTVRAVTKMNGDSLTGDFSLLEEPVTLHFENAEVIILEPNNGIVLSDSLFLKTPSLSEYQERLVAALDGLIELEAREIEYWRGESELLPSYAKIFAAHPAYVANSNWLVRVGKEIVELEANASYAEVVWAQFKSSVDRLKWQGENEDLIIEFNLLTALISFQKATNSLVFLSEEFLSKNKKEIRKYLLEAASELELLSDAMGGYAGDYRNSDATYGSETSLAGMTWHFGAFVERFNMLHPSLGEELVSRVEKVVDSLQLNTIQGSSGRSYLMACLNYYQRKALRLNSEDASYPLKALTEILNNTVYLFYLDENDSEAQRLVQHGFALNTSLLSSPEVPLVEDYLFALGRFSTIYTNGWFLPVDIASSVIQESYTASWNQEERIRILEAFWPIVKDYNTIAVRRVIAMPMANKLDYGERIEDVLELIELISGGDVENILWLDSLIRERDRALLD